MCAPRWPPEVRVLGAAAAAGECARAPRRPTHRPPTDSRRCLRRRLRSSSSAMSLLSVTGERVPPPAAGPRQTPPRRGPPSRPLIFSDPAPRIKPLFGPYPSRSRVSIFLVGHAPVSGVSRPQRRVGRGPPVGPKRVRPLTSHSGVSPATPMDF